MHNVTIKKVITRCDLTADQLELYAHADRDMAARAISDAIITYGNDDTIPHDSKFNTIYEHAMRKFSHTGACDSEPIWVVEHVLKSISE